MKPATLAISLLAAGLALLATRPAPALVPEHTDAVEDTGLAGYLEHASAAELDATLRLLDESEDPKALLRALQAAEDTGPRQAPTWLAEP